MFRSIAVSAALLFSAALLADESVTAEPVWPVDFESVVAERVSAVIPPAEATVSAAVTADFDASGADEALSPDFGGAAGAFVTLTLHWDLCDTPIEFSTLPIGLLLFFK